MSGIPGTDFYFGNKKPQNITYPYQQPSVCITNADNAAYQLGHHPSFIYAAAAAVTVVTLLFP